MILKPSKCNYKHLDLIYLDFERFHFFGVQISVEASASSHLLTCLNYFEGDKGKRKKEAWSKILEKRPLKNTSIAKISIFHQNCTHITAINCESQEKQEEFDIKKPKMDISLGAYSMEDIAADSLKVPTSGQWKFFYVYMTSKNCVSSRFKLNSDKLEQWDAAFIANFEDNLCIYKFLRGIV